MLQVDTEELLERFLELFRVHRDSGLALIKLLEIYKLYPNQFDDFEGSQSPPG
jgi:hypothetical protein